MNDELGLVLRLWWCNCGGGFALQWILLKKHKHAFCLPICFHRSLVVPSLKLSCFNNFNYPESIIKIQRYIAFEDEFDFLITSNAWHHKPGVHISCSFILMWNVELQLGFWILMESGNYLELPYLKLYTESLKIQRVYTAIECDEFDFT